MIRIIIALLILVNCQCLSALRFGADTSSNDLSIVYSKEVDRYVLVIQRSFQYMMLPFTLCFRLRPLLYSDSQCHLTNETGPFDCLARNPNSLNYYAWTLSSDYKIKSNQQIFIPSNAQAIANTLSLALSLEGIVGAAKTDFSFLGKPNSIFEVLAADNNDLTAIDVLIKRNYVSSFYKDLGLGSDNLLMPAQVICMANNSIINLVFLGRRYRQGNDVYMVAFINYHLNHQNFLMWQGLSFAKNKVNRDMMGVNPLMGTVQDLFSLYKTAPFLDTSTNINGSNDWNLLASSQTFNNEEPFWFYYTQVSRLCNTGDIAGDEVLMFKIGNQYCYAAYFDIPINATTGITFTNKAFKHQMLRCFEPDLVLADTRLALPMLMIFVFFFWPVWQN